MYFLLNVFVFYIKELFNFYNYFQQKGLVLGIYESEKKDENEKINLTPAAIKYNEICDGKLLKQIQL